MMQKPKSTYVIAEAGVNHNGSLERACELVDIASHAGANAIKFQTFNTGHLVSTSAPKAEYQKTNTGTSESQYDMLKRLELSPADHHVLMQRCAERNIAFLSTPFDLPSIQFLAKDLDLPRLKTPSGEITNSPYLLAVARTGKDLFVSTGMCSLGEVEEALSVLAFGYTSKEKPSARLFREAYASEEGQRALRDKVTLLHCTTEYPAAFREINLRAMATLRQAFHLPVGLSDHSAGITIPLAAVALGASVVEKHFTLSRNLPGPDHAASLEPDELVALVQGIVDVESALGDGVKRPAESEWKNRAIARKSLVASMPISKGERFSESNMTTKRPGTGVAPGLYWDWLERTADRDYAKDEVIDA